jgi:hypothetical protein
MNLQSEIFNLQFLNPEIEVKVRGQTSRYHFPAPGWSFASNF